MSVGQRIKHEIKSLAIASAYFGVWLFALIGIKTLLLAQYEIHFEKWSAVLVGTLVLAKVVLVLEHVSLGRWVARQPAWVDVVVRTLLYSFGVVVVLALEHAISERHEHGGIGAALIAIARDANTPHVWVNAICISSALLGYNALSVLRLRLGDRALLDLFLTPIDHRSDEHSASTTPAGTSISGSRP